jgi:hypothetical protein
MIKRSKNQPHNKFDSGGRKKITAHKRALRLPDSHLREPIKYGFFNADDSLSPSVLRSIQIKNSGRCAGLWRTRSLAARKHHPHAHTRVSAY